jgi:hypothetical protein
VARGDSPDRVDHLRLFDPPLDLTVSFADPAVGAAVRAAYAGFVDIAPGRAPGARTLHCVVDPCRRDALLARAMTDDGVTVRTAGSGPSLATGVALGRTLVLAGLDRGGQSIVEREIRMLLSRQLLDDGWVPMHAAGLVGPTGQAILLMGPKRAGKTTTLLGLLRHGAGLMANDKLFVRCRYGETPMVRSLPVAAGLRGTTVALFPELASLAARRVALHVDNVGTTRAGDPDKLFAPVQAIADAFGVPVVPTAPLGMILAVRFTADLARSRSRPLEPRELADLLATERLDRDVRWCTEWLGVHHDVVVNGIDPVGVPAFRVDVALSGVDMVRTEWMSA